MPNNKPSSVGLGSAARAGLAGLGPIGRSALLGLALSAAVAVALGFLVPRAVRNTLLDSQLEVLSGVVRSAEATGLIDLLAGSDEALALVGTYIDERVLGSHNVRVEIIDLTGRIVYSDFPGLIGERFPLSESASQVLGGADDAIVFGPAEPENEPEAGLEPLTEFIFPVRDGSGAVVGLFEIYQPTSIMQGEVADIRRTVWIAIVAWLGIAAVSTALLTVAAGRQTVRQFRRSEKLLEGLLQAEEAERRRVVGALHNDVGQPLYRILFGLQTTRRRLGDGHPDADELGELERLARGIDKTLRSEFNILYRPVSRDETLGELLDQLVARMGEEMPAKITTEIDRTAAPGATQRETIYRAAEEALANVRRHADAGSVSVRLAIEDHRLLLSVEDDGKGGTPQEGIGLLSTRERLEAIGGGLSVGPSTVGTLLTAWIPFREISPS